MSLEHPWMISAQQSQSDVSWGERSISQSQRKNTEIKCPSQERKPSQPANQLVQTLKGECLSGLEGIGWKNLVFLEPL